MLVNHRFCCGTFHLTKARNVELWVAYSMYLGSTVVFLSTSLMYNNLNSSRALWSFIHLKHLNNWCNLDVLAKIKCCNFIGCPNASMKKYFLSTIHLNSTWLVMWEYFNFFIPSITSICHLRKNGIKNIPNLHYSFFLYGLNR